MKPIYKILITIYSIVFIAAVITLVIWLFTPDHTNGQLKKHAYTVFDSTFSIKTPFLLKDDSLGRLGHPAVEDSTFSRSYASQDIEFMVECIKFKTGIPDKNKKLFLNTWLSSLDTDFHSVSKSEKEGLLILKRQKYEFYEGVINYGSEYRPTGHKRRYFTSLITAKGKYLYFIDMRYNEWDKKTIAVRNDVFNSITIK